jgi:RimJ/RimL family protein N-acetyltransferase
MKNELMLIKVVNLYQAELLRVIRNGCYRFMTSHSNLIKKSEQIKWFNEGMNNNEVYLAYLNYRVDISKQPIGYGLISYNGNLATVTGCLKREFRGMGLGEKLFDELILKIDAGYVIELDVLKSNHRAIRLYEKLGFRVSHNKSNEIIRMVYKR